MIIRFWNVRSMSKKWFNIKEKSAGTIRLRLTWWIYKHFGELPVRVIVFFVALGTFLCAGDVRKYSYKFFEYLYEYTDNSKFKPSILNSFKHIYSFANSLADKMLAYSDNYQNIKFDNKNVENKIVEMIDNKQGAFFITNHIGCIEMLRAFIASKKVPEVKINVFLQQKHCEIFNSFINSISMQEKYIELMPIEEINIETAINIEEKINSGEFVFMAGDRISVRNVDANYSAKLLNHKISLPLGVLKFAIMLECPIFTTVCPKINGVYNMCIKEINLQGNRQEKLSVLQKEYADYLESCTLNFPYQFYHFFDIFESCIKNNRNSA